MTAEAALETVELWSDADREAAAFRNLLGDRYADAAWIQRMSLDTRVTELP